MKSSISNSYLLFHTWNQSIWRVPSKKKQWLFIDPAIEEPHFKLDRVHDLLLPCSPIWPGRIRERWFSRFRSLKNLIWLVGATTPIYGLYMVSIWIIYGLYMENQWITYGSGWWLTYPLKNMSSSIGMMTFAINMEKWWKMENVPNHQPLM